MHKISKTFSRLILWALPLLVFPLLFSCRGGRPDEPLLAQVNNEYLTAAEFNSLFSQAELDTLSAAVKRKYIEDWVNLTLLAQAADEAKLARENPTKARLEYARKKVKANAMIGQRLAGLRVSEDELFSYFRIHRADFETTLKEYSLQRIQLNDKAAADLLLSRLISGLSFDEAVRTYSMEALRSSGGMMGFVSKSSADSIWWNAASGLGLNQPSLLSHNRLWYIFRIVEERAGSTEANFDDYRVEIRRRIIADKEEQIYLDLVRELKARTDKIYYY